MTRSERIIEEIDRVGRVTWAKAVELAVAVAGGAAGAALVAELLGCGKLQRVGALIEVR